MATAVIWLAGQSPSDTLSQGAHWRSAHSQARRVAVCAKALSDKALSMWGRDGLTRISQKNSQELFGIKPLSKGVKRH